MLEEILLLLAGLTGLGTLISVIVNLLKIIGIVKDGTSETWYQILNLVAFVGVAVVYFAKLEVDWGQVDQWLILLSALIGYVLQILGGKLTYQTIGGKLPILGYSHSQHLQEE